MIYTVDQVATWLVAQCAAFSESRFPDQIDKSFRICPGLEQNMPGGVTKALHIFPGSRVRRGDFQHLTGVQLPDRLAGS